MVANRINAFIDKPFENGIDKWTNEADNRHFYDKVPIKVIQNRSALVGLNHCCDLDLIQPYINSANTVLEVGACYGRVLAGLLERGFTGKLSAIERSERFCALLRERFADRVELHDVDLLDFTPSSHFDLILWLFCGIADFPNSDQARVLNRLASFLSPNGTLVLDTLINIKKPSNTEVFNGQSYVIKEKGCVVHGYTPSAKEIQTYAESAGLKVIEHRRYETPTGTERCLHILSKTA